MKRSQSISSAMVFLTAARAFESRYPPLLTAGRAAWKIAERRPMQTPTRSLPPSLKPRKRRWPRLRLLTWVVVRVIAPSRKGRLASLFCAPDLRPADPQRRKEPTLQTPLPISTKSQGWKGESVPPSIAHYPIDAATLAKRETAWLSEEVHLPSTDQP